MGDRSRRMDDDAAWSLRPDAASAPSSEFALRRASVDDVPAVTALEQIAFTDPWSASEFQQLARSARSIFIVAADSGGGSLGGYVIVAAVLDEAEVLNLAVSPSCRGLGVGGMLLDAALSEAAAAGATSVFLEVRESNVAARALYASRGFTEISRRSRYYRQPVEDALVLRGAVQ